CSAGSCSTALATGADVAALYLPVALGLDGQGMVDVWAQGFATPQRVPQVRLDIAEETGAQPAVRRQAHAVAAVAVVVAHRRDHADRAGATIEAEVSRGATAVGPLHRLERADAPEALQHLVRGNVLVTRDVQVR